MSEIVEQEHDQGSAPSPFARIPALGAGANVGSIAIEQQRAIAEVQGQIIIAQRFPRSMAQARADFMDACKDPEFAKAAFYTVPNRGTGPSIRFAEEVARCYGNFQYGHRELSRTETKGDAIGKSEVEVFAWDVEKNNRSVRQITIMHTVDTREGPKKLRDQADIDNRIANIASKQIRGRILALMPKHIVAAGIAECKKTLAGNNDKPISERVNAMVEVFKKYGVTVAHLEEHLGHKVDATTVDELADLTGIYNAIKEGAKPSEYFKLTSAPEGGDASKAAAIAGAAQKGAASPPAPAASKPPPAATPSPTPAPSPAPTPAPTRAPRATPKPTPAPEPPQEDPPGDPPSENGSSDDDVF